MRIGFQLLCIPLVTEASRRDRAFHNLRHRFMAHVANRVLHVWRPHDVLALLENHRALIVHHIVEFQQLFANLEIARLDLGLGFLDSLVDPGMDDGLALFQTQLLQHAVQLVGSEDPHQVILKRQEEFRGAGIALATGTAAELIVDPP